jgi:hypothetical protein
MLELHRLAPEVLIAMTSVLGRHNSSPDQYHSREMFPPILNSSPCGWMIFLFTILLINLRNTEHH